MNPFLPVIQRGDLRDYNQLEPCLHLNAFVPVRANDGEINTVL